MPPLRPVARGLVTGLGAVTLVHLVALLLDADVLADVTQVLLMPLLAGALAVQVPAPRGRLVTWTLVALGFSWLGDAVPRLLGEEAGFLAMVGFFLIAQLCYVAAFWPYREASVLRRHPLALVPILAVALALVALCAGEAGVLLPAIVLYAGCLSAMAVLATGVHTWAAVGGVVFLVSDGLIALNAFTDLAPPAVGFWVMLTYVAAQALLCAGVVASSSTTNGTIVRSTSARRSD